MKKSFLPIAVIACSILSFSAGAQSRRAVAPVVETVAETPETSLDVTVVTQKESVRTGPYARFAQKYLGVMAPLADKDIYTISEVTITPATGSATGNVLRNSAPEFVSVSNTRSDTSFVKVNIDKNSTIEQSAEAMAQHAAETIFMLRKRRIELLTGDLGEHVYGQGLNAAINELNRLENEYLALFMGKQFRRTVVNTYDVTPEKGKNSLILFRFSDTAGPLAASDLTGRPVIMEFVLDKTQSQEEPAAKRDNRPVSYVTVDMVQSRIMDGKRELASRRMRIPQLGTLVEVR